MNAMLTTWRRWSLAALACIAGAQAASGAASVPELRSPVTDLTRTLTPGQVQSLEQSLRAFEARKGSQVAVLIVPSIEPETIEQYSLRVVEAWKLGRKGVDDGVLFVIAKNDRVMRIEVGYGLEGALTDAQAKRIVRDIVTPHFRAGEYYLGIVAGVDSITRTIDGEPLPAPTFTERARKPGSDIGGSLPVLIIASLVVGGILRGIFGRFGGAAITSIGVFVLVWLIGTFMFAVVAAIISFFITLLGGGMGRRRGWYGGYGGRGGGGGFGGGWSGGGGGFGGGGASGRW